MSHQQNVELVDAFEEFFSGYYDDRESDNTPLLELAQNYPSDQRSLEVNWQHLFQFDPNLADDYLSQPEQVQRYAEEALRVYDIPIDVTLEQAHVRVWNLPEENTYFPGGFSPSKHHGTYRAIRGEVVRHTDTYPKIEEAAFECQLCGCITYVPQSDSDFQEPHECKDCERQGPFKVNFDQSEFVDAQKIRVKMPPELAEGPGQKIDVFVEDDITDCITIGDRVKVSGIIRFEQEGSYNQKKAKFDPYLEGHHVEVEETDQQDLDVTAEERRRIEALANGEEGDPLELAANSLSPKIHGYQTIKKALILSLVSGGRIEYPNGDADRASVHTMLLGDPGTAKSKMVDRAENVGWRTVPVSSKRATVPGLTATAEQDDFTGNGEWTLKAGAFVKANGGTVCIDELDDMKPDTRAAMLEPMSKQRFNASIAGEQATFQTEAAVVAAANPEKDRFDHYEPIPQQFGFEPTLLSRFDLVFTLRDIPDEESDKEIATHMMKMRDAAKRANLGEDLPEAEREKIDAPIDEDLLRKYIGLAKQQPNPPFESDTVRNKLRDTWLELRSLYDHDDDNPVPVTFRKLEAVQRVAETAAKFDFSDVITEDHVKTTLSMVGKSMEDIGKNEDGELDADIHEVGKSNSQKSRMKTLQNAIVELTEDYPEGVPREEVVDLIRDEWMCNYDADRLHSDMDTMIHKKGTATEPKVNETIRYLGNH